MALAKQFVKSKSVFKVTFTVPAEAASDAKKIALVGEFNGWNPEEAIALKKQKDGSFKNQPRTGSRRISVPLHPRRRQVENDWAADKYVPAGVDATENSVVVL